VRQGQVGARGQIFRSLLHDRRELLGRHRPEALYAESLR
jgi:hypothetical protein